MEQKDAPKPQKVITEDPLNVFRFENEWSTSAFSCCEDLKLSMFKYEIFKYDVFLVLFVFIFFKIRPLFLLLLDMRRMLINSRPERKLLYFYVHTLSVDSISNENAV